MLCYYLHKKETRDSILIYTDHTNASDSKTMYKRSNVLVKVKVFVFIVQGPIENVWKDFWIVKVTL